MRLPKFQKSECFYIEYVDEITQAFATSGSPRRTIARLPDAIASFLASVDARRWPPTLAVCVAWDVLFVDLERQGAIIHKISVENKRAATMILQRWNDEKMKAVCVIWPAWAPPPIIAI